MGPVSCPPALRLAAGRWAAMRRVGGRLAAERLAAWLVAALLGAGAAVAQPASLPRVVVVGASVSAGFATPLGGPDRDADRDRSMPLATALRAVWPRGAAELRSYGDLSMFLDPETRGAAQIARAVKAEPDLVIGIDFLFWFGYGAVGGADAGAAAAARLRRQAAGLALLDRLQCPMVLGDYPDMTGADPRMLSPRQIPAPATLAELNARLRAWAAERPRIALFPLADWIARVKARGDVVGYRGRDVELAPEALLQSDMLHATRLGVALLAHRLAPAVQRALPAGHPLPGAFPALEQLLEGCRVDLDIAAPAPARHDAAGGRGDGAEAQ